jgi:uridine kinase
MRVPKPFVVSINSVSGGGKTTVSALVRKDLRATLFSFDDFDDTNVHPADLYEWVLAGADLLEFDFPGMADAVQRALEDGSTECVVLDYPFGRDHPRFRPIIDLSVFIDTPLDVAMARRVLRDYVPVSSGGIEQLRSLRAEMAHYIERARIPYLDAFRHKETSDLALDGCRSPEGLSASVVKEVRRRMREEPHNAAAG